VAQQSDQLVWANCTNLHGSQSRRRLRCFARCSISVSPSDAHLILQLVTDADKERSSASSRALARFDDLLAWPYGVARLGAALCVALAIGFGLVYYPRAIDRLGNDATRNSSLSFADRDVAGGNSIVPDQLAAYQARALIPADERYRVVVGPNLKDKTDLTVPFASSWMTYFLMPRRPSDSASWVVCFGCDMSKLGAPFHALWTDEEGISIGRLGG
jgi:hypothetical protein